ncbi:MAG: TlpA family protein disulfide reductase [Steroidobacteraceae bacterium]
MKHIARIAAAAILGASLCGAADSKAVGDMAPEFSRADLAGKPVRLADYRGKLVLLNFWASWCGPCLEEMPRFSGWQREYGAQGLQVIGVSMDDDAAAAKRFIARHPSSYPILLGDAELGESFGGVFGLPLTYLIDPKGRIVARYQGNGDLAKMEAKIKALLALRSKSAGGELTLTGSPQE